MSDKDDIFYCDKSKQGFPTYRLFPTEQSEQMFEDLFSSFKLKDHDEKYLDGNRVREAGQFLSIIDEAKFKLSDQLNKSKIIVSDNVIIYFLNFSKVYEFKISDVDKFFDDIYYPIANDIMISDKELSWMLYIDHDCYLYEFSTK